MLHFSFSVPLPPTLFPLLCTGGTNRPRPVVFRRKTVSPSQKGFIVVVPLSVDQRMRKEERGMESWTLLRIWKGEGGWKKGYFGSSFNLHLGVGWVGL